MSCVYTGAIYSAWRESNGSAKNIKLVLVGCGTPALGRSLKKKFAGESADDPNFQLFVDSDRSVYTKMGLQYGLGQPPGAGCCTMCARICRNFQQFSYLLHTLSIF